MSSKAPVTPEVPSYITQLGLDSEPFQDHLEDRFFYADPALMQRLDLLQHLTQFNEQLLLIKGPAGAGKTTLLRQLKLRAADHWRLCLLDSAALKSPADLYVQLSQCFPDAVGENTANFGSDLMHYCLGLQQNGLLPVVLLDDADHVPVPVFTALLEIGGGPTETLKAMRILAFATPEFEATLLGLGLASPKKTVLHSQDLPPFDTQQSAAYLMYRLAIAGYSGDSPFSATEIRAMHKAAEGRPGQLNRVARETLVEHGQRLTSRRTAAEPDSTTDAAASPSTRTGRRLRGMDWRFGVAAVAVIGIATAWIMSGSTPDEVQTIQAPLTLPPIASAPQAEPPSPPVPAAPIAPPVPPPSAADTPADAPPLPASPALPAIAAAPETAQDETPAAPAAPDEPATPPAATATPSTPVAATPPPPAPKPAAAPPAPTAQPPSTPPTATAKPATDFAAWFQQQPDDHYTLQLLGAREPATVQQFLGQFARQTVMGQVLTQRKGRDWYVVIHGSYPSKEAALKDINNLPKAIQKQQPWPRRFDRIRAMQTPAH